MGIWGRGLHDSITSGGETQKGHHTTLEVTGKTICGKTRVCGKTIKGFFLVYIYILGIYKGTLNTKSLQERAKDSD